MVKLRNPFCVSGALMKEIFKMYWYIPLITFVLYFFTGIIPILSNISNIESIDYYIYESIKNTNIIYTGIMCATPVITAVLMMGFIHKESKAMMLHALPLSRNRIFNSYYISGWLMCVLPLILMVIPYMLLALKIDVLARVDVLLWLLSSVAVMTWFYGITVFTGSLTGTAVMNILATGVLTVIFPLLVTISSSYCDIFIQGYYKMPEWISDISRNFNPAEIFMGDTGATFLGYTLAVTSILGVFKGYAMIALMVSVLAVGFPIFDTLFAMTRRAARHQPIMQADRGHLHHKLIDRGFSQKQAVMILYGISAVCAAIAIFIALKDAKTLVVILFTVIVLGLLVYFVNHRWMNKGE